MPELAGFRGATADSPLITVRHLLDDVERAAHRRSVGRPSAGTPAGCVRRAAGRRVHVRVAAGDRVRVLEPRLRDPGPGAHERERPGVSRPDPRPVAHPARDGCHGLRGRSGSRCPARAGTRAPGWRLRRRAVRSLRRAGVDGRRVQLRARPHDVGARVRRGVPRPRRPRGNASVVACLTTRDAAGAARLRSRARVDVGRSRALAAGRRLRVRVVRLPGPDARTRGGSQRWLPGVRLAHALASRVGRRGDRPGQPHLRADVPAGDRSAEGARRGGGRGRAHGGGLGCHRSGPRRCRTAARRVGRGPRRSAVRVQRRPRRAARSPQDRVRGDPRAPRSAHP